MLQRSSRARTFFAGVLAGIAALTTLSTIRGCSDERSKIAETKAALLFYNDVSLPIWQDQHPTLKDCPPSIAVLRAPPGGRRDPWGRDYIYACDRWITTGKLFLGVRSDGPDRTPHTDDDLRAETLLVGRGDHLP